MFQTECGDADECEAAQNIFERPSLDVQTLVLTAARQLLGADVAADTPLAQAGLDSLGALELRVQLNRLLSLCYGVWPVK